MPHSLLPTAIVGSGPAGLMAASVLAQAGRPVVVLEKRSSLGRKILIAGSSGLNVSFDSTLEEFVQQYRHGSPERWRRTLTEFSPSDWLNFIRSLGLEVFCGSSGRYFVRDMKGASLLRAWTESLKSQGVLFHTQNEVLDFRTSSTPHSPVELLVGTEWECFGAVLFALGGGSWDKTLTGVQWPEMFRKKALNVSHFISSNCGFKVEWPAPLLSEAEGQPIKNTELTVGNHKRRGELIITQYGLEGTPIYAIGTPGPASIDLKPDLNKEQILTRIQASGKKLAPIRLIQKYLDLSPGALAVLFHLTTKTERENLEMLVSCLKTLPVTLGERQPLDEAISSSGGLSWDELDDTYMLKRFPGVFAAGEMLNWDAPTGGYLIQACVSQGYLAGKSILRWA